MNPVIIFHIFQLHYVSSLTLTGMKLTLTIFSIENLQIQHEVYQIAPEWVLLLQTSLSPSF